MIQQNLFNEELSIPGLTYVPDYISSESEEELLEAIDSQDWCVDLKRRTQHYGYKYDYKARSIDSSSYLGPMPYWARDLCSRLRADLIFAEIPDQVIINEYMPGQGIAPHIDCIPCFTDTICSLSLESSCIMDFSLGDMKKNITLEPKSLLILQNEARYSWKHGISARKSDHGVKRQRRISLTFRKIIKAL